MGLKVVASLLTLLQALLSIYLGIIKNFTLIEFWKCLESNREQLHLEAGPCHRRYNTLRWTQAYGCHDMTDIKGTDRLN